MSRKLSPARPASVAKALRAADFRLIRQSGSHAVYRHPDGRWTTLSIHPGKTIPKGTLRKIIRDAGLTVAEFTRLLGKR